MALSCLSGFLGFGWNKSQRAISSHRISHGPDEVSLLVINSTVVVLFGMTKQNACAVCWIRKQYIFINIEVAQPAVPAVWEV